MKFQTKIKIMKQKRYFELGYGVTSYIKIIVAVVGIGGIAAGGSKLLIALMLFLYGVFCYIFGWAFIKYHWYEADIEVGNIFNLFVKEMRKKLKIEKFK